MSERGSRAQDEESSVAPELDSVLADDRLVESVGSGQLTAADVSDDVVALLVAWRDQVDAAPLPLHPDVEEAQAALAAAVRVPAWRVPLRVLSPVAAAAAAVGIALIGIGFGAHESAPGDPLWGVSQAIFSDHSRSVQAAANVTAELAKAETAIASGAPERARTALDRAAADLPSVHAGEDHQGLELRRTELVARLDQTTSTDPSLVPVTTAPGPSTAAPVTSATLPSTDPTKSPPVTTSPPATTSAPATTSPPATTTVPATSSPPATTTVPATTSPPATTTVPATTSPPATTTVSTSTPTTRPAGLT